MSFSGFLGRKLIELGDRAATEADFNDFASLRIELIGQEVLKALVEELGQHARALVVRRLADISATGPQSRWRGAACR